MVQLLEELFEVRYAGPKVIKKSTRLTLIIQVDFSESYPMSPIHHLIFVQLDLALVMLRHVEHLTSRAQYVGTVWCDLYLDALAHVEVPEDPKMNHIDVLVYF